MFLQDMNRALASWQMVMPEQVGNQELFMLLQDQEFVMF